MREEIGGALVWKFLPKLWKGNYKIPNIADRPVICVNENNERIFPKSSKIPYLWIPFNDPGEDLTIEKLKTINSFVRNFLDEGLIIHCYGGRNRSSAICMYIMKSIYLMDNVTIDSLFSQIHSNVGIRRELADKIEKLTGYNYLDSWID